MSYSDPTPISRRSFFATSIAAFAAMRCASSVPPLSGVSTLPAGLARLRARPASGVASCAPTREPARLGLASGRDGAFYVPSITREMRPLILLLHGAGGSGMNAIRRFQSQADRLGAILLAPDSRGTTWDLITRDAGVDAPFIDRALDYVFRTCSVDSRRIAVAGFSDGASYALTLGLTNGDFFSSVAAFSPGILAVGSDYRGTPRIFISHGTNDDVLAFDQCGRRFAEILRRSGYSVDFRPFEGRHTLPPEEIVASAFDRLSM